MAEYPAFHLHPYIALWAVHSKISLGWVGWWTITGDLPTDYISSTEAREPSEAMRALMGRFATSQITIKPGVEMLLVI